MTRADKRLRRYLQRLATLVIRKHITEAQADSRLGKWVRRG